VKFNPTWQQVALLAVLLAAVIVSHMFAPAAASAVVSIVSTVVGALFVDLRRSGDKPAPVLELVPKAEGEKEGGA
jgi:hypothetical protein